jgi:hypothetical protein
MQLNKLKTNLKKYNNDLMMLMIVMMMIVMMMMMMMLIMKQGLRGLHKCKFQYLDCIFSYILLSF